MHGLVSLGLAMSFIHTVREDGIADVLNDVIHPTVGDCDEFLFVLFAALLYAAGIVSTAMANRSNHAGIGLKSLHPGRTIIRQKNPSRW